MSELAYKRTNVYQVADEKLMKAIYDYAEGYKTFIDELALLQDKICISAGLRGLQLIIAPQDLATACNAQFIDLVL